MYGGRLFVANVGESRALLCRTDKDGVLRVLQLSVDHNLSNEDELLRLQQLGLNMERLKQGVTEILLFYHLYKYKKLTCLY